MTATLFDHAGRPVRLGASLGRGGEGEVFAIDGSRVAKLYHEPPDASKTAKLMHMIGASTPALVEIAAWPLTTLHAHPGSPPLGFAMPLMRGIKPLHLLYGPVHRRRELPDRGWDYLLQVAINCAAAFDTVHMTGAVVGDVNANNIQFTANALVRLIDCDSFQVTANGQSFLCEVGVPEYTPPELQEKPFRGVLRTVNHDSFGLAVLVFQLLFMGRHPFFGRYAGHDAMTIERAIRELRFAFGRLAAAKQMSAPPHVLPFSVLPASLADLFERAFSDRAVRAGRPSPRDWLSGLQQLQRQLAGCAVDPTHKFPAHVGACPWCAIAATGGPAFFASPQLALDFVCAPGDVDRLVAELHELLRAQPAPQLTSAPAAPPRPFAAASEHSRTQMRAARGTFFGSAAMFAVAASFAIAGAGVAANALTIATGAATILASLWIMWVRRWSPLEVERRERAARCSAARADYHLACFAREQHATRFRQAASQWTSRADTLKGGYARLRSEYDAELAALTRNSMVAHKHAFLEDHEIADAKIEKIGPAKKRALLAYGIETAYDVLTSDITFVPGIGPALRARLVDWAQSIERRFRFDPAKGLPAADRRALVAKYRCRQLATRGDLEALVSQCRQTVGQYESSAKQLVTATLTAEARRKSAEAELAAVPPRARSPLLFGLGGVCLWLGGFSTYREAARDESRPASVTAPAPAPAPAPTPAPVDAAIARPTDGLREGVDLVTVGAGAARRLRYAPRDGARQRLVLELTVMQSEGDSFQRLPKLSVRALASARKTSAGSFDYTVTLERLRAIEPSPIDATAFEAAIGDLAGSALAFTVTAHGAITDTRITTQTRSSAAHDLVMQELHRAFAYMFVDVPDADVAQGARWRSRRQRRGDVALREETTTEATAMGAAAVTLALSSTVSPPPTEPILESFKATLVSHVELRAKNLVPTVTAVYDAALNPDPSSGSPPLLHHIEVSIRPQ